MEDDLINKLDLVNAVSELEACIKQAGVAKLRLSYDVGEFEMVATLTGKGHAGEHLRRSLNTLSPNQVLWIGAYDSTDRPVATIAARYDDVRGWTLQRFVREFWSRAYRTEDGSHARLSENTSQFAKAYTGPFVYIGEGFVADGWKDRNLSIYLLRLIMLLAYDEWRPNLIYGWMRPYHVLSGLTAKWGFTICYQKGLTWEVPPARKDWHDLHFVALDKAGIFQLIMDPAPVWLRDGRRNSRPETGPRNVSQAAE